MTTIGTRLFTWFCGRKVGVDAFGNAYYEERHAPAGERRRRWVIYKGRPEASKVPAAWHIWLHYTGDAPLDERAVYAWEAPHQPNLTGTTLAYRPSGDLAKGARRASASADYQPWNP